MLRAAIEFLLIIVLAMVARAILTSIFRGIGQASANAFQQTAAEAERRQRQGNSDAASAGILHKDPVCGTFVAESTPFSRVDSGRTIYFCSKRCREAFTPVSR